MKHLIAAVLATLVIVPAAQAQDWKYQDPGMSECFAITMRGDRAFAIQGPARDGSNQGVVIFFASLGVLHDGAGDILFTFGAPGKWSQPRVGHAVDEGDVTSVVVSLNQFSDLETLPDRFQVKVARGKEVALDTEVTDFRTALAAVRSCVAAR